MNQDFRIKPNLFSRVLHSQPITHSFVLLHPLVVVETQIIVAAVEAVAMAEALTLCEALYHLHIFFTNHTDNRPLCQVCHKHGHIALVCFHCFNHLYQAAPPPNLTANFTAMASPTPSTSTWFPDTAATHHFTPDFSNLNLDSVSYQVNFGDGSSLPIQHVGTTHINSPFGNFLLNRLLRVPSISRNLLYVRQFCQDHPVFFEFHSTYFLVKDSRSWEVLL